MVERENATEFYLNQHVYPDVMRVSYELIPEAQSSNQSIYKAHGDIITKGNTCIIDSGVDCINTNSHDLYFREHFNENGALESICIYIDDGKIMAMDNYGDGRVVWWNMEKNAETGSLTPKSNQKFKLIFTNCKTKISV